MGSWQPATAPTSSSCARALCGRPPASEHGSPAAACLAAGPDDACMIAPSCGLAARVPLTPNAAPGASTHPVPPQVPAARHHARQHHPPLQGQLHPGQGGGLQPHTGLQRGRGLRHGHLRGADPCEGGGRQGDRQGAARRGDEAAAAAVQAAGGGGRVAGQGAAGDGVAGASGGRAGLGG